MEEYEIGDLVVSYLFNTSMLEPELLQFGVIVNVNRNLRDIMVLDNAGYKRWYPCRRWRILRKKNT